MRKRRSLSDPTNMNRTAINLTLIVFFIWCLYLPAYELFSHSNVALKYTNLITSFYEVEALIIYSWLPCIALILFRLIDLILSIYKCTEAPKWLIIVIHFTSIFFFIVDMIVHNFHFNQIPLIAGYLALGVTILSWIEFRMREAS